MGDNTIIKRDVDIYEDKVEYNGELFDMAPFIIAAFDIYYGMGIRDVHIIASIYGDKVFDSPLTFAVATVNLKRDYRKIMNSDKYIDTEYVKAIKERYKDY